MRSGGRSDFGLSLTSGLSRTSVLSGRSVSSVSSLGSVLSLSSAFRLVGSLDNLGVEPFGVNFSGKLKILGLAPEVGCEESVGVGKGVVGSLEEIASSSGATLRRGVDVLDTRELENLLGDGGSDNACSSGSGNESDSD